MLKKSLLLSVASFFLFNAGHAQGIPVNDTSSGDDEPEMIMANDTVRRKHVLQPIEVRSVRAAENAPFAKTNLTKAEIARQNLGQDVPVLLQFTPSAVTTSDAGTGIGYTGIRIRGTDPTRINVTFNGMPVNDPEEQNTFFVDIPDLASSTTSIQVQRGVGTSTNGPGAFGGTISISNLGQMDSAGAFYSGSVGSYNTLKNTLVVGSGMLKNGWQFDLRLSKISSDGYVQRSAADLRSLQFTAGYTPNARTSFHFLFMPGTEKTGQAWNGVPQDSLATNRRYNELGMRSDGSIYNNQTDNYLQNYYQLFGDHKFSNRITGHAGLFLTRGKGYYEEYKAAQLYSGYYLPDVTTAAGDTLFNQTDLIRRLYLDNYYYGGVFSLQYNYRSTFITLGGGWSQFTNLHYGHVLWAANGGVPDQHKWYQNDAQKNDGNVYLKAERTIGKVILFGDVQYRNVAYFMNGFRNNPGLRQSVNYDFFNPKAGITWLAKNTPNNHQKAYASVAVANREPNRSAFEVSPANQPKPERLMDVEAGYEVSRKKWSAGVNLYYMDYYNQLVLTGQINDVGAYVQTNVNSSYRAGLELQAAVAPTYWFRVMGNATLSQNSIRNFTEYTDNYDSTAQRQRTLDNTTIAFSPRFVGALTAAFTPIRNPKGSYLEIDVTLKAVGKQYLDNTANDNRAIAAYNFTNVLVRYGFKLKPFKEVIASATLNNVFGALYATNGYTFSYVYDNTLTTQNYYYPQAPFNVLGGITLRW